MKRRTFLAMVGAAVAALHLPSLPSRATMPVPTAATFMHPDAPLPAARYLRYRIEWPIGQGAVFNKSAFARISTAVSDPVPAYDAPSRFYVPTSGMVGRVEGLPDDADVIAEESDNMSGPWRPARNLEIVRV